MNNIFTSVLIYLIFYLGFNFIYNKLHLEQLIKNCNILRIILILSAIFISGGALMITDNININSTIKNIIRSIAYGFSTSLIISVLPINTIKKINQS